MTEAQAKFIARAWGNSQDVKYDDKHSTPTARVCVQRGWLVPTAKGGRYPNGDEYVWYEVSWAGVVAMASALRKITKT